MIINTKNKTISATSPTYFIADIAANHDGDLARALDLIELAAKAGANAAKFQHFKAETIVSDYGFRDLGAGLAHQKKWEKSVVEVYRDAELPLEWTHELKQKCDDLGIDFFSAIYDLDYLEKLSHLMPFFKIGSGDLTWAGILERTAAFGKPMFIATGASSMADVHQAMRLVSKFNIDICLMQCNTNYTGADNNPHYANLRVLSEYRRYYPNVILGLSDHTSTTITTLGAVALGATVIEKHFTDDRTRKGPDHSFSLDYEMWSKMVEEVRELEASLGDGTKRVEENEIESQVVQRRAARVIQRIEKGETITSEHITYLRPCPPGAATPFDLIGTQSIIAKSSLEAGEHIPREWLSI